MARKRKFTLGAKAVVATALVSTVLVGAATGISYSVFKSTTEEYYSTLVANTGRTVSTQLDGDRIAAYVESFRTEAPEQFTPGMYEPDSAYFDMLDKLSDFRNEMNLKWIYVVSIQDGYTYQIMDADYMDAKEISNYFGSPSPNTAEWTQYTGNAEIAPTINHWTDEDSLQRYWLCSGYAPIYDSTGKAVACVGVDISMDEVVMERQMFLLRLSLSMLAEAILLSLLFVFIVRRAVVKPVNVLASAAGRYAMAEAGQKGGVFEAIDVHTGDEIEALYHSFCAMEQDLNTYIKNLTAVTAEKERIGAELDVAKHIQASMLPSIFPAFPERLELDIYATMTPAKEVGGDFYDFFLLDDDRLAMVMADVSGKGVPAALFMVIAKILLKNVAQTGLSPKHILEKVNNQLCVGNEAEMFVTVWLGILELSTGRLTCANAGHELPALKRADGDYELVRDKHGFVLAGMEGSRYKEYELQLNPGDKLFLYTDGVPEATDADNQLFGTARMLETLNRCKTEDCKTLLCQVQQDIDTFVGQAPQFDDITMLSLEIREQTNTMKKLKMAPSLDSIEQATAFLEQELAAADVPLKIIAQINIATDEIFSNIALYSGASDATIGISIVDGIITLRFADNGLPYDPTEKPDPDVTLSAEDRSAGGLGIYMVKKSMDTVEYEYHDGLNILQLTKQF